MAHAQISTQAFGLAIGLAVSACGGGASPADPQPQAAGGSTSSKPGSSDGGKSGSTTSPSSSAGTSGPSTGTPSGGATARPDDAGRSSPTLAGNTGAASTPAANGGSGSNSAGQSGAPAAGSDMRFSFFMTSFVAMQKLSNSTNGFGGDLRYGESNGLAGADKICREIAESSMPGSGSKTWRAFLSATKGPDGMPVHAIDRIGEGPWYDRLGRLFAMTKIDAINVRPKGAHTAIINDFPNEDGVPNHAPDGMMQVDNHDVLTGTGTEGKLFSEDPKFTCQDWTSSEGAAGTPRVGHSWPRSGTPVRIPVSGSGGTRAPRLPPEGAAGRSGRPPDSMAAGSGGGIRSSGDHWMSSLNEAGCAAGASLVEMGGPIRSNPTVGSGGGYGAIYCFALTP